MKFTKGISTTAAVEMGGVVKRYEVGWEDVSSDGVWRKCRCVGGGAVCTIAHCDDDGLGFDYLDYFALRFPWTVRGVRNIES